MLVGGEKTSTKRLGAGLTEAWREDFPAEGLSAEAPLAEKRRYFQLRYAALFARLDAVVDAVLGGDALTASDIQGFRLEQRGVLGQLETLREQAKTLGAVVLADAKSRGRDLDALAGAVSERAGFVWEKKAAEEVSEEYPPEGPPASASLASKKGFFQQQLVLLSGRTDALRQRGEHARAGGELRGHACQVAQDILRVQLNIIRELRRILGAVPQKPSTTSRTEVDLLAGEVRQRQRLEGLTDWETVCLEGVAGYIEDIRLARRGDFNAYLRLVGRTDSSTDERPTPLDLSENHHKMIHSRMADLMCARVEQDAEGKVVRRGCGKFHLQDVTPRWDAKTGVQRVPAVTCPHCGLVDCAGPKRHRTAACRGLGKSSISQLGIAFRVGLSLWREYEPEWVLIGSNQKEAKKRLQRVAKIMRRPGHQLAFPNAVPYSKPPGFQLRLKGRDTASVYAHGIESMPPGTHGDGIEGDDLVNEDNTFRVPAKMRMIRSKINNVITYSDLPWTVMDWDTTVWRAGDPDEELETYALNHPTEWTNLVITAGGPDADNPHDYSKGFESPWPSRWSRRDLYLQWDKDDLAYRRAMMMERVSESDIVFHRVPLWISRSDRAWSRCPEKFRSGEQYPVLGDAKSLAAQGWVVAIGVDLGFTGAEQDVRNRSKTGIVVSIIDALETKRKFVLYAWEDYIRAGQHEAKILEVARAYGAKYCFIEADKAVIELVEKLQRGGLEVETYSPSGKEFGGSKIFRKLSIAADFNEGRAFVGGHIEFSRSEWTVLPLRYHGPLRQAALAYPSRQSDVLDACEIVFREQDKFWGGAPQERSSHVVESGPASPLYALREAAFAGRGKRGNEMPDEMELGAAACDSVYEDAQVLGILSTEEYYA